MTCTGEGVGGTHCCYVNNETCRYLVENQAGRRYACSLYLKFGSWEAMNVSAEYQPVGRFWQSVGQPHNYCETFSPVLCCQSGVG